MNELVSLSPEARRRRLSLAQRLGEVGKWPPTPPCAATARTRTGAKLGEGKCRLIKLGGAGSIHHFQRSTLTRFGPANQP